MRRWYFAFFILPNVLRCINFKRFCKTSSYTCRLCEIFSFNLTPQILKHQFKSYFVPFPDHSPHALVENGKLPERYRFNRLCRQDGRMFWWIRYELVQHHVTKVKPTYTTIDSLPLPLCHGMQQPRVKALHGVADFGYNATVKRPF